MPNSLDYFTPLSNEIRSSVLAGNQTEALKVLLEQHSIDIKNPLSLTVAGNFAKEGEHEIVDWCYEAGASPEFIVEGFIRGSVENPDLEEVASKWCRDKHINPISLLRGYAFIGAQDKIEAWLSAEENSEFKQYAEQIREELAISALLGGQFEYYQDLQNKIPRKTDPLLVVLGRVGNLSLIKEVITELRQLPTPNQEKYRQISVLMSGVISANYSQEETESIVRFLEAQIQDISASESFDTNLILRYKAIGAASIGDLDSAQGYLEQILEKKKVHHKFEVALTAMAHGYQQVGEAIWPSLLDAKKLPGSNKDRTLYATAKNGMFDRLLSLLNAYKTDTIVLQTSNQAYDSKQDAFSHGFSAFWSLDSLKERFRHVDPKISQFFKPILEIHGMASVLDDIQALSSGQNVKNSFFSSSARLSTLSVQEDAGVAYTI